MSDPSAPLTEPSAWARRVEHGTMLGMRFGRFLFRAIGRRGMDWILWGIAAYFFVVDAHARRASRDWLETAWSLPAGRAALRERPGRFAPLRHMHHFAINMLDRMVMWLGQEDTFAIDHRGGEALLALAREGRGAILLGAHLGSFDMLRLISRQYGLRVNVVMYTNHSARVNKFFESLGGESQVRVIRLDPSSVQSAFEIKACLDRGEFVGILADRVHPGGRERPIETLFVGRRAVFPLSPFLLGVVLGAPMFLSLCTSTADARYFAVTEPIFAGGRVPRGEREKIAREALEDWVRRFESHCLSAPLQWFNFYTYFLDARPAPAEPHG
jgi:predicted LPLAT superfamily acyltransferase